MSTYNQNFRSEPYFGTPGSGRRGRRRRSVADPRLAFRRRLGAMVMLGILVAPVVWATRNDGKPVGITYTGGAAAVVQFDPTAGTISAPPTVAPPSMEVPTSPAPAPEELVEVDDTQPADEPVAVQAVECLSYTVQTGDSWYGIADKAGVKAGEIAGRNGMTLQSNLLVGSEICLPPGATLPPIKTTAAPQTTQAPKCSGQYTVRAGDSWSLIASRHSVSSTDLAAVNNKTVKSTLLIGDVLCLPVGAKAPAATQAPSASSGGSSSNGSSSGGSTRTYSREELEQIVRDVWPDQLEKNAFYVVHRESRWTPNVKNAWPSRENPCCYGLFQINWTAHKSWLKDYGVTTPTQLFDPVVNTKMAYVIYQRANGWTPWWTSGWRPTN
jgi:LysM repeat protein